MAERKKLYRSKISETAFREKLTFLIDEQSQDRLKGHVKKFNPHRREKIFGRIEEDKFWIWKHGLLSGGIFYPIFYGEIINRDNGLTIQMNSKPNSLGGIFFIFISFLIIIGVAIWLIYFKEFDSRNEKIFYLALAIIIFLVVQAIPNLTHTLGKREFRKYLEEELKMERIN